MRSWCPSTNVRRHHFLDRFRLNLELLQTRQGSARKIIRFEKINLAGGERWVWQELEQPRLDLGSAAKGTGMSRRRFLMRCDVIVTSSRSVYTPGPASS